MPMETGAVGPLWVHPNQTNRCWLERPVWMAPAFQMANWASDAWVGCSLVSGLSMQWFMLTAGPDGIRELGPTLVCGL